jgi:thioredoxin reductase (NADPH)
MAFSPPPDSLNGLTAPDLLNTLDLLVVGAGPAGVSLAVEAIRSGIDASRLLVVEKGEAHRFAVGRFEPDAVLPGGAGRRAVCHGVPAAMDPATGEVLSYVDRAIRDHGVPVRYREAVLSIRRHGDAFHVNASNETYRARLCALALGTVGRAERPAWAVPAPFRGKIWHDLSGESEGAEDVLVVGGGDTAAEFSQALAQEGHRVVLSYRGISFRRMNPVDRASVEAMERSGRLCILRGSEVIAVEAAGDRAWVHFSDHSAPPLLVDRVVLATGGPPPERALRRTGIDLEGRPVPGPGWATSVQGLFLVTDLAGRREGGPATFADAARDLLLQAAPGVRRKAS